MFELGRDLKRFVADGARGQGRDPRVLELLPCSALAQQASAEASVASQAQRPWKAWRDVALIWTAHARRTGMDASLEAAGRAARRAMDSAPAGHAFALASAAAAETLIARFDLRADPSALAQAESTIEAAAEEPHARRGQAAVSAAHARLRARQALAEDDPSAVRAAAALLDAALHLPAGRISDPDSWRMVRAGDLRLDRAELTLQAGLRWKDERLLEQAGRDLRVLIDSLDAHLLPVSRGRAVRMCGLALASLGAAARRAEVIEQSVEMLACARDLFDVEHSPLDAAAILSAQAETMVRWQESAPVTQLLKASEALLGRASNLIAGRHPALEVEVRVKAARVRTLLAARAGDLLALSDQESRLRLSLATGDAGRDAVGWATAQLCLAEVYEALDDLGCQPDRRWAALYARKEASDVLRERGIAA